MKENREAEVIEALMRHIEGASVSKAEAPVRRCHRYLSNHRQQSKYREAIAAGLPIGSGEVEGGHRYVVQARLKKAGAWWKPENARKMLALRVNRANGEWRSYWQQLRQAVC